MAEDLTPWASPARACMRRFSLWLWFSQSLPGFRRVPPRSYPFRPSAQGGGRSSDAPSSPCLCALSETGGRADLHDYLPLAMPRPEE
jgi:hypothetical protein